MCIICQEYSATHVFNSQAFLKKRSRSTNQPPEPMVILPILFIKGFQLLFASLSNVPLILEAVILSFC